MADVDIKKIQEKLDEDRKKLDEKEKRLKYYTSYLNDNKI